MYITRVLAELLEDAVHREQRPERVAVGVLVRREQKLVRLAQLGHHLRPVSVATVTPRPEQLRDAHAPVDRLVVGEAERGVRFMRSSLAIACWRSPCAASRPARVALALVLVAEHAHVHAGMAQIRACIDSGHRYESYARVLEALRDPAREDLTDRLVHPAHAVAGHASSVEQVFAGHHAAFARASPSGNIDSA